MKATEFLPLRVCPLTFLTYIRCVKELKTYLLKLLTNWIHPGPEVIKEVSILNSAEQEILNAHKYKNIKKFSFFQVQISLKCYVFCS